MQRSQFQNWAARPDSLPLNMYLGTMNCQEIQPGLKPEFAHSA